MEDDGDGKGHPPNPSMNRLTFLTSKRHSGEKSGRCVVIEECIQDKFRGLRMADKVETTS